MKKFEHENGQPMAIRRRPQDKAKVWESLLWIDLTGPNIFYENQLAAVVPELKLFSQDYFVSFISGQPKEAPTYVLNNLQYNSL